MHLRRLIWTLREKNHIYDEMWSADWWWDAQVSDVVFGIWKEALTSENIRVNYPSVQ